MADRRGDPEKQPANCPNRPGATGNPLACPNLKETSSMYDMDGETYSCAVCGEYFRLYYDDMK